MMLSVAVYILCAIVSILSGRYFFRAWKSSNQASHHEFSLFFYVIGLSFIANSLIVFSGSFAGIVQELSDVLALISFGFVLRASVRFQQLPVSFGAINIVVGFSVFARLLSSFYEHIPGPVVQYGFIYPHYGITTALVQGIIIALFALLIAATLFANLKNIKTNKNKVIFLGTAFVLGGVGGALLGADDFVSISIGNVMLVACFAIVLFSVVLSPRSDKASLGQ